MEKWIADEFKNVAKSDHRLKRRCIKVVSSMSANPAGSIYSSQQDASDLKAAYRFFGNQRISEDEIFYSQIDRLTKDTQTLEPTVLLNIQDTMTLDFTKMLEILSVTITKIYDYKIGLISEKKVDYFRFPDLVTFIFQS